MKRVYWIYAILGLFILGGFLFRLWGIMKGLSFWNDENHVAIFARGILWHGVPVNENGVGTKLYQILLYYITAGSFVIFGINEFAARLPSVIAGTVLIAAIFFVTRKILGEKQALVAAFLTAFSQIQLAWSTQLRPYIWIALCTLFVIYYSYQYLKTKQLIDKNLIIAGLITIVAFLFHGTGLINILYILLAVGCKIIQQKKYVLIASVIPLAGILVGLFYILNVVDIPQLIFKFHNNSLHYRIFFTFNYDWLLVGAGLGALTLWGKNKRLLYVLSGSIAILLFLAAFKIEEKYVRYVFPTFPLLYILFAAGTIQIGEMLTTVITRPINITRILIPGITVLLFFLPGIWRAKILLKPLRYYTINGDMRENPIVDYKTAFERIKTLAQGKDSFIVMDAWNDRVPWYMPHQKFIWLMNERNFTKKDNIFGEEKVNTIKDFELKKSQYKSGVVIVENWESQTPPELQNYIRTTLKKEFDVENLPYNTGDNWSISVYSWGIEQ